MELQFKPLEANDIEHMMPFYTLRPNRTCDSVFLDSFIWKEYYHLRFAVSDNKALQILMEKDGVKFSAMPMCREEDLSHYFYEMVEYFNMVLKCPFLINLADEAGLKTLNLDPERFLVTEQEDLKDYLYDAQSLRTLAGKKLHKKKNHVNSFLRDYEGRYLYRSLGCSDRDDVWRFLDRWWENKTEEEEYNAQLDSEVRGIHDILKHCSSLYVKMAGVYIDRRLEAFTMGSYNELEEMAVIHIEKANSAIRGLYQFINREFLQVFPDEMKLVNREDDVGMEGLRRAKMSYCPVDFARKYTIRQKGFQG